jgi:hypothetical protein
LATGNENLYNLAYRHGSTYEHSDGWSVASFEPGSEHLTDGVANLALLVAAFAFFHLTVRWGEFLGIETAAATAAMERAFLSGFPGQSLA